MSIYEGGTAEHAAVGCCIVDNMALLYAIGKLTKSDFEIREIGDLFAEIEAVYTRKGRFGQEDALLLKDRDLAMACMNTVGMFGGLDAAKEWIDAVKDASVVRRVAEKALTMATNSMTKESALALSAEIVELLHEGDATDDWDIKSAINRWLLELGQESKQFPTGIAKCDAVLQMEPGMFLVIGGRPSAGKTALGLQMMMNMAKHGKRCVFFSLETSPTLLLERMASNWGHIPYEDYTKRRRGPDDPQTLLAVEELEALPIDLVPAAGHTVQWMASIAAQKHADVIFIDYLQLIPQKGDGRYEQVTKTSMELHTLAQQSHLLVIALAQLNREIAGVPTLRNLKESGQIEQDADGIILLNNTPDEYYFEIAKNKRGITGSVNMTFDGAYQTFYEVRNV